MIFSPNKRKRKRKRNPCGDLAAGKTTNWYDQNSLLVALT